MGGGGISPKGDDTNDLPAGWQRVKKLCKDAEGVLTREYWVWQSPEGKQLASLLQAKEHAKQKA